MRIAALTFVRNEFELLPVWLNYYHSQVDELYVVNPAHEDYSKCGEFNEVFYTDQDNGSIEQAKSQVHIFMKKLFDDGIDWLIYGDVDEFIIPDPAKFEGVRDFIKYQDQEVIYCSGYDVIEDSLPRLDLTKPILAQRKRWVPAHPYNKPAIMSKFQEFGDGWHYTERVKHLADKNQVTIREVVNKIKRDDVYLVHLKRADEQLYNRRQGIGGGHRGDWEAWLDEVKDIPERIKNAL
jgi:hypothetical protein